MNKKRNFTLGVISKIDDEIVEQNLNKRFAFWQNRKRSNKKLIISVISAAACFCIVFGAVAAFLFGNGGKQIPVYNGMTVSGADAISQNMSIGNGFSQISMLNGNGKGNGNGNTNNLLPSGSGSTYHALKNEDIYIHVHLSNPDSFEILSFTLNGKKYSSNMFEPGSDLETLILKYNVGDVNGIQEYTIDAIKYIDGEKIKDVRMDGDRTVRVYVNDETKPLDLGARFEGFDLIIEPTWKEEFTGDKTITSLSLWEGDTKLRDLDVNANRIKDLPSGGRRLALKATYFNGDAEEELLYVFDTKKQSEGLLISGGKIMGIGTCTYTELYLEMPIADNAFAGNIQISKVYLGDGATSIGASAFNGCTALTEIAFAEGKDLDIGYEAFRDCSSLKSVDFPEGFTKIDEGAFLGCSGLEEITLPSSLKVIKRQAFFGCQSLTKIVFSEGLQEIGVEAFSSCHALKEVTLPMSMEILREAVFWINESLEKINIENTNIKIEGISALASCRNVYFNGTKAEWRGVVSKKDADVYLTVHCTDGDIVYSD